MAVMDEFREVRENLKNASLKTKIEYFVDYYKWHVIIVVIVIAAISSYVYSLVTRKDIAFNATFINTMTLTEDEGTAYMNDFAEVAGIDTNEYEVRLDPSMAINFEEAYSETTYANVQKVSVYIAAGEIDALATSSDIFAYYAHLECLEDFRNVFTEEQMEILKPYLYYVDAKVIERKNEAAQNNEMAEIPYPDPRKPEEMEDPIPIGLFLDTATEEFNSNFLFTSKTGMLGIACTTKRPEATISFIEYILGIDL